MSRGRTVDVEMGRAGISGSGIPGSRTPDAGTRAPAAGREAFLDAHSMSMLAIRGLDLLITAIALLLLAPLLLLVGAAVWLQDGGPVIYRQLRVGRGGGDFYCLKFRSMAVDAEARLQAILSCDPVARAEWLRDHKLRNDPRITPLGRVLRKSSLDELPQLLNVMRGEMSLVGPRPIVRAEVVRYGRRYQSYCEMSPGLTGLWQVGGRNDTSYKRRVAFDCVYRQRRSVRLYLRVVILTVPAVLFQRGSY